jgi:4,5-DOPA dioxygenase extradiol
MTSHKQPALFVSHGTIYEAFKSEQLKQDFARLRQEHIPIVPSAIVLFSGHWQTESITVSTSSTMHQMDEGFPLEFITDYTTPGDPILANRIISLLQSNDINAKSDPSRVLDHGALIPLLLLFPEAGIPVIQISQRYDLDPVYHEKVAKILAPLREENILFIGSGGLVHNRNEIVKMSGHSIEPSTWAKDFDEYITNQLQESNQKSNAKKMIEAYNNENFKMSHPTSEHFLPIVFASAMGGNVTKIYEAFQWKNLSMSAFKFD